MASGGILLTCPHDALTSEVGSEKALKVPKDEQRSGSATGSGPSASGRGVCRRNVRDLLGRLGTRGADSRRVAVIRRGALERRCWCQPHDDRSHGSVGGKRPRGSQRVVRIARADPHSSRVVRPRPGVLDAGGDARSSADLVPAMASMTRLVVYWAVVSGQPRGVPAEQRVGRARLARLCPVGAHATVERSRCLGLARTGGVRVAPAALLRR